MELPPKHGARRSVADEKGGEGASVQDRGEKIDVEEHDGRRNPGEHHFFALTRPPSDF